MVGVSFFFARKTVIQVGPLLRLLGRRWFLCRGWCSGRLGWLAVLLHLLGEFLRLHLESRHHRVHTHLFPIGRQRRLLEFRLRLADAIQRHREQSLVLVFIQGDAAHRRRQ